MATYLVTFAFLAQRFKPFDLSEGVLNFRQIGIGSSLELVSAQPTDQGGFELKSSDPSLERALAIWARDVNARTSEIFPHTTAFLGPARVNRSAA
jgi:hypothetical protein